MYLLTPEQYPCIAHIIRDESEFVCITLAFQRQQGEFWVDRPEAPSVVIGLLPKDTFVSGDLTCPGVKPLLARAQGLVADAPGLEPLLQEVWRDYSRLPSVESATL